MAECSFLVNLPKEVKFLAERRLFVFRPNEVIDFLSKCIFRVNWPKEVKFLAEKDFLSSGKKGYRLWPSVCF